MKKLYAGLIGVALAGSIVGAVPATAAPTDLQVQARFVSATCQGGDFANVKLTAASRGGSGTVQYAWDFRADADRPGRRSRREWRLGDGHDHLLHPALRLAFAAPQAKRPPAAGRGAFQFPRGAISLSPTRWPR